MSLFLSIAIGFFLRPYFLITPWMGIAGGLFLLLSSWEFNPRELVKELPVALKLWLGAFFLPLLVGIALVYLCPTLFLFENQGSVFTMALVIGISFSVSAVPVVIKIMQELGWYGTSRARVVLLTAILCDVAAWLLFLPLLPSSANQLSWISSHLTLLAFFIGIAVAVIWPKILSFHRTLGRLNVWIVAPLFFIGVGQNLDFSHGFNGQQAVTIFLVATASKVLGILVAAKIARIQKSEAKAIAAALNARGAMEIVMASFALQSGLIDHDLFLSLVVMALGTSFIIKPLFQFKIIPLN